MSVVRRHDWPGNVRELLHAMERAMVVSDGNEIRPEDLPRALRTAPDHHFDSEPGDPLPSLEALEREHIERVLRSVGGHRGRAARILGTSERNLYRKLNAFGIR